MLLLDDVISPLDKRVQRDIFFKLFKHNLSHKTRVVVNSNFGFLPHFDKIVVMDEGRIVEVGSYS